MPCDRRGRRRTTGRHARRELPAAWRSSHGQRRPTARQWLVAPRRRDASGGEGPAHIAREHLLWFRASAALCRPTGGILAGGRSIRKLRRWRRDSGGGTVDRNARVRPTVRRRKAEYRRRPKGDDGRHRQRHRVPVDNRRRPRGVRSRGRRGTGRHKRRALAKVDRRNSSDCPRELALTARQRPGGGRWVLRKSGRGTSARARPSRPNWRFGQA